MIVNQSPAPLRMSDEQQKQITKYLKTNNASGKVAVFVDGPTEETQVLSAHLIQALRDANIEVSEGSGTFLGAMNDPVYPGISFDAVDDETKPLANLIGLALINAKVIFDPVKVIPGKSDKFMILVRRP